jgi:FkbM family methyltransferase
MRAAPKHLWRLARPYLNRLGIDIVPHGRYPFTAHLRRLGITLILDVGANIGQFVEGIRRGGFTGSIVSFEPVKQAFDELSQRATTDDRWLAVHSALGAESGKASINVSNHTTMSSFRTIKSHFVTTRSWAGISRHEIVPITTLDAVFSDYVDLSDRVLLKIDVQGFEDQVLLGASQSLPHIAAVQLEAAITPTYEDEPELSEYIASLRRQGFRMIDLREIDRDADQRIEQVDAFFERGA